MGTTVVVACPYIAGQRFNMAVSICAEQFIGTEVILGVDDYLAIQSGRQRYIGPILRRIVNLNCAGFRCPSPYRVVVIPLLLQ